MEIFNRCKLGIIRDPYNQDSSSVDVNWLVLSHGRCLLCTKYLQAYIPYIFTFIWVYVYTTVIKPNIPHQDISQVQAGLAQCFIQDLTQDSVSWLNCWFTTIPDAFKKKSLSYYNVSPIVIYVPPGLNFPSYTCRLSEHIYSCRHVASLYYLSKSIR